MTTAITRNIVHHLLFPLAFMALVLGAVPFVGFASPLVARTVRLAYFEAGDYPQHRTLQLEYRKELSRLAPPGLDIIYPPYGYKTAAWDRATCKQMAREIASDKTFDLVIAMGPWVVEDLLEAGCRKPIVAMGRFAPELEGLVDGKGAPRKKNLTVRLRPGKLETDFAALTALIPSARIGVMYFPSGVETAVVEKRLKELAKKAGSSLVFKGPKPGSERISFFRLLEELKGKVDAIYLTPLYGLNLEQLGGFFQALKRSGIPAFSSDGYYHVERGAFATNVANVTSGVARYQAKKTIQILQGENPSSLSTTFSEGRRLVINLQTCQESKITPNSRLMAEARLIPVNGNPNATLYTFSSALDEARLAHPDFLASEETIRANRSRAAETSADYFPQISGSAYWRGYDADPPLNALGRNGQRKSGYDLTVSQKIFDLAALKSIKLAGTDSDSRKLAQEIYQLDMQFSAALAYLDFSTAMEVEEVVSNHRERTHNALQSALTSFQLNEGERLEVVRWERRKEEATVALLKVRAAADQASATFLEALGRPFRDELALDRSVFSVDAFRQSGDSQRDQLTNPKKRLAAEESWVQRALGSSLTIKLARAELARKRAEISLNTASFLPTLTAEAGYFSDRFYEYEAPLGADDEGWVGTARIRLPIFSGGKRLKERSRLKFEISALEYQVDGASLAVATRIRRSFVAFAALFDQTVFSLRALRYARDAYEVRAQKYDRGEIEALEMEREIESALASELAALQARRDYFAAALNLQHIAGLQPSLND